LFESSVFFSQLSFGSPSADEVWCSRLSALPGVECVGLVP
jgi:hypothetical protein